MKKTLSRNEAYTYMHSLPFKEDFKESKSKFIDAHIKHLTETATAEKRDIMLSEVQDSIKFLVTTLESDVDFGDDDGGQGAPEGKQYGYHKPTPSQELESIQKRITEIESKPRTMQNEMWITSLRNRKEALQKALRS